MCRAGTWVGTDARRMAGLTISAALVTLALLPGFIACFAYYQHAATWRVSAIVSFNSPRAIIWGILLAGPAHGLWLALFASDSALGCTSFWLDLLTGRAAEIESVFASANASIARVLLDFGFYVATQAVGAVALGQCLGIVAEGSGYNQRIASRSKGEVWHQLLLRSPAAQRADALLIKAVANVDGRALLYTGFAGDYDLDEAGNLVRITLEGTVVEPLDAAPDKRARYPIPAEITVLNCTDLQVFEIDYIRIAYDDEAPRPLRELLEGSLGLSQPRTTGSGLRT